LPVNGTDTGIAIDSGRSRWHFTPQKRLQRAQSRLLLASVIRSQPS